MADPNVTEEITCSTIETCKTSTAHKKRILRNTWRGNAVQVNSYDADGRLQSCETDKKTYRDMDTEYYNWTDRDPPPCIPPPDYAKQVEPFGASNLRTRTTHLSPDGSVLTLTSSETHSLPVVHWSGESRQRFITSEQHPSAPRGSPGASQSVVAYDEAVARRQIPSNLYSETELLPRHGDVVVSHTVQPREATRELDTKLSARLDGGKWSRTIETVWMAGGHRGQSPNLAIAYGAGGGAVGGKTMQFGGGGGVQENGGMTVEERKKLRRNATREMTNGSGGGGGGGNWGAKLGGGGDRVSGGSGPSGWGGGREVGGSGGSGGWGGAKGGGRWQN